MTLWSLIKELKTSRSTLKLIKHLKTSRSTLKLIKHLKTLWSLIKELKTSRTTLELIKQLKTWWSLIKFRTETPSFLSLMRRRWDNHVFVWKVVCRVLQHDRFYAKKNDKSYTVTCTKLRILCIYCIRHDMRWHISWVYVFGSWKVVYYRIHLIFHKPFFNLGIFCIPNRLRSFVLSAG